MCSCIRLARSRAGQATVEAAFLIPVLLLMLLLLIQPGILLYNRVVMQSAAADACRMLKTQTDEAGPMDERARSLVLRHLGAVPQQDLFHVHDGGCSWDIDLQGNEGSSRVSVSIANTVQLLPLIDAGAALFGVADADGRYTQRVEVSQSSYADWVQNNVEGLNPGAWASKRMEE